MGSLAINANICVIYGNIINNILNFIRTMQKTKYEERIRQEPCVWTHTNFKQNKKVQTIWNSNQ